jgi:hypothetical protein
VPHQTNVAPSGLVELPMMMQITKKEKKPILSSTGNFPLILTCKPYFPYNFPSLQKNNKKMNFICFFVFVFFLILAL